MKRLIIALTLFCGGCLLGCTIETKNNGEIGLEYGTKISFYHRAQQTSPESAKIESSAPALVEWFLRTDEPNSSEGPPAKLETTPSK